MPFLTTVGNQVIDKILRNTDFTQAVSLFASIHSGDPAQTGANEITAYDGDRKAVTFIAPVAKVTNNNADIDFVNMPAVTVTHGGLWSAATAGTFWWGGALAASRVVAAADTFRFPTTTGIVVTLT